MFQTHKYMKIFTENDPKKAFELIKQFRNKFDAIIIDYDMPNINGCELA